MKKIFSVALSFVLGGIMAIGSVTSVFATDANPYGTTKVGCITDIKMESSTVLLGGVKHFTSVVTSHIQGLEDKAAIPYRTYGAIGSEESKMFVYSVGTDDGFDFSRANVKEIVKRFEEENPAWKAVAAVNGDFFDIETVLTPSVGEPEFPMIQMGNVYKSKILDTATGRGVVGVTEDGKMLYYTVGDIYKDKGYGTEFKADRNHTLGVYGESRTNIIAGYTVYSDHKLHENRMMFITPDSAPQDFSGATIYVVKCDTYRRAHVGINGTEMGTTSYFIDGEIIEIREGAAYELPPKGYAYFATPYPEHYELLKLGTEVNCQKNIGGEWADVTNAIGFKQQILAEGNLLLKNCYGKYNPSGDYGSTVWTEDIYDYPYCWKDRTAVGFKEDGTPVLLVLKKSLADNDYKNMAASYYEIAEQLKALGCTNGFLLDGGGSSTFVIRNEQGEIVNAYVGEGDGRAVANAVILAVRDESVPLPEKDEEIEVEVPNLEPTEREPNKKPAKTDKDSDVSDTASDATEAKGESGGCNSSAAMPALAVGLGVSAVLVSRSRRKRG